MLAVLLAAVAVTGCGSGSGARTTEPRDAFGVERWQGRLQADLELGLRDVELRRTPGGGRELHARPVGAASFTGVFPQRSRVRLRSSSLAAALDGLAGDGVLRARVGDGAELRLRNPRVRDGRLTATVEGPSAAPSPDGPVRLRAAVDRHDVQVRNGCPVVPLADCGGRAMKTVDLLHGDLRGADLRRVDLHRAWAPQARLAAADLRGADLRGADLAGADLRAADLRHADLSSANLRNARLAGARLNGAVLCRARGADRDPRTRTTCDDPRPESQVGSAARTITPIPEPLTAATGGADPATADGAGRAPDAGPRAAGGASVLTAAFADLERTKARGARALAQRATAVAESDDCEDPDLDTDDDGLTDCTEQAGFEISVRSAPGLTTATRTATSDPTKADTDGDTVTDGDEFQNYLDPRRSDTDNDRLRDDEELRIYGSRPTDGDSDGDATPPAGGPANVRLLDGSEAKTTRTSPASPDTDGDGLSDLAEVTGGGGFSSARIADLPSFSVGVDPKSEGMKIAIPVTTTTGTGTSTENTESTVTAKESRESHSAEVEIGASFKQEFETGGTIGIPSKAETKQTLGFEESVSASTTNEWESTSSLEQKYAQVRATEATTEKEVEADGCVIADLQVRNTSAKVGFTLSRITVKAYVPDVAGGRARELAALQPIGGNPSLKGTCPGEDQTAEVELGPGEAKGPVMAGESSTEELLDFQANPGPVTFRMSNYVIENDGSTSDKRSFAKVLQDVNANDAAVVVDYGAARTGDERTLTRQVAANLERDPATGRDRGVAVGDALQTLGLDPEWGAGPDGEPTVTAIDGVRSDAASPNRGTWVVSATEGTTLKTPGQKLEDVRLRPGQTLFLRYLKDGDGDGIPDGLEDLQGTSDDAEDTDGDGLTDEEETVTGWTVPLPDPDPAKRRDGEEEYVVHSSPISCDADGDGSPDGPGRGNEDHGTCPKSSQPPESGRSTRTEEGKRIKVGSDPGLPDTNADGVFDGEQRYPDVVANVPPAARLPFFARQLGGVEVGKGGGGAFNTPTALAIQQPTTADGDETLWVQDPKSRLTQGIRLPADGGAPVYRRDINRGITGRGLAVSPETVKDKTSTGRPILVGQLAPVDEDALKVRRFHSETSKETGDEFKCCTSAKPPFAVSSMFGVATTLGDGSGAALDVDPGRNLYVAVAVNAAGGRQVPDDIAGGGVARFSSDRKYVRSYGKLPRKVSGGGYAFDPGAISNPVGVAVDRRGDVFVVQAGYPNDFAILKFRGTDGALLKTFFDSTALRDPTGVGVDRNGCVYVTAGARNGGTGDRVHKFDNGLTHLGTIGDTAARGTSGPGNGRFRTPVDVDFDRKGNVFVLDQGHDLVQEFRYPRGEGTAKDCGGAP